MSPDPEIQQVNKARILVADDEMGIRDMLRSELEAEGHTVVAAANGMEALKLIEKEEFNLVLSDIKMPGMDGLELLAEIKRRDPNLEVILVTGFGTIETAVAAMKMGAYDFLQKPFNLDEMHSLVKRALEKVDMKAMLALYEASKAIYTVVNLEELLPVLADIALRALRADDVSIFLLGWDATCSLAAHSGGNDPLHEAARALLIDDKRQGFPLEPKIISGKNKAGAHSAFVSPLRSRGGILGFLYATRTKTSHPFTLNDLRMENILSSQMSQAIENARLYRKLERKIDDLNAANRILGEMQGRMIQTEKLASLGEMAGGVAHELNNPLTAIVGLSDLLLEGENKDSEKWEDLNTIKEQSVRCGKIVTNLLQFARQKKSEKKKASITHIIEDTLKLIDYEFKSSGIELVKEFSSELEEVTVDSQQIQQVFLNLINNARHALEGRPAPKIVIRTEQLEGKARVVFEDNGCGISEKNLSKIFDPFFTTKEVGKGTGLGMSISYGIVRDHNGDIRVESQEGKGARFTVEFPGQNINI